MAKPNQQCTSFLFYLLSWLEYLIFPKQNVTKIFFWRHNIIFGRPLCQGATLDRVKALPMDMMAGRRFSQTQRLFCRQLSRQTSPVTGVSAKAFTKTTETRVSSKIFCNRLFLNLMLLGRRLIMTGAVEVFQCHHHMVGWPEMIERQERDTSFPYQSASALNCIIVQFDRRYQMNQWPELKLKMKLWM